MGIICSEEQGKAVKVSKIQRASHNEKIKLCKKKAVELEEIEEHPLLDLLNNCNPYMTGTFMRQLTQIYLDSVGEAFWIKERNNLGMPIEALACASDRCGGYSHS